MNDRLRSVLSLALLAIVLYRAGYLPLPPTGSHPPIPAPSQSLQELVDPIRQKLAANPEKARQVSEIYSAFAEVIRRDAGQSVKDSATLSVVHSRLLQLYDPLKNPRIGADIDNAIAAHLSIPKDSDNSQWLVIPIDSSKLTEILEAIAWAGRAT